MAEMQLSVHLEREGITMLVDMILLLERLLGEVERWSFLRSDFIPLRHWRFNMIRTTIEQLVAAWGGVNGD